MENKKTIAAIRDFIITAEKSIKNAKKLLKDVLEENNLSLNDEVNLDTMGLNSYSSWEAKIIEWVFTGNEMLWVDDNRYPVPANYCSKSKLVQGDKLKLTIDPSWKMLYKQIAPIERQQKTWLLTKEHWKFQVISEENVYNVLTAAVTHFKWNIWDKVTILVPAWKQATYAAIEAIIPSEEVK